MIYHIYTIIIVLFGLNNWIITLWNCLDWTDWNKNGGNTYWDSNDGDNYHWDQGRDTEGGDVDGRAREEGSNSSLKNPSFYRISNLSMVSELSSLQYYLFVNLTPWKLIKVLDWKKKMTGRFVHLHRFWIWVVYILFTLCLCIICSLYFDWLFCYCLVV